MRRPFALSLIISVALVVAACGDRSGKTLEAPLFDPPELSVASSTLPPESVADTVELPLTLIASWVDGATVPGRQTCLGGGVSPALTWANVPIGTAELAITVVDVDAGDFVHWLSYAIPAGETGLIEGQLPASALEWPNDGGSSSYTALCPPAGETHQYRFTLYALNQQLEVADDASASEVISQLEATTIARASVSGLVTTDP